MSKSLPHPRSRKTPRGGRMMAMMILQMSLQQTIVSLVDDVGRHCQIACKFGAEDAS